MTVLLVSWDFIAIQRDVYFIVRVLIAVLIMFTYICGPRLTLRPFTWYQGLVSSPDAETVDGRNSNCPEVRVVTSKLLFNPDEILRGHPTWKSIIPSIRRSDTSTRFMLQNLGCGRRILNRESLYFEAFFFNMFLRSWMKQCLLALTLKLPWMTKTEFLLTISMEY